MTTYNATFYDYVDRGAIRSAERLLPQLLNHLHIESVLDVGCGRGAWLSVFARLGVVEVSGIDGDYVARDRLLIPPERFFAADLARDFSVPGTFDLVMSLEVAEHLPEEASEAFVANLVRHGSLILFSAAPKGQGGHHHVNEQDYDYWRELFARHDYVAIDLLRPLLVNDGQIEPWYRYNPLLYAKSSVVPTLPVAVRLAVLAVDRPIPDLSPLTYRLRKLLVRLLPPAAMTWLAQIKENWLAKS